MPLPLRIHHHKRKHSKAGERRVNVAYGHSYNCRRSSRKTIPSTRFFLESNVFRITNVNVRQKSKIQYNIDGTVVNSPLKFGYRSTSVAHSKSQGKRHVKHSLNNDEVLMRLTCAYVQSFPVVMSGRLLGGAPGFNHKNNAATTLLSEKEQQQTSNVSVASRMIAWLDWAFMEDGEGEDDASVSTVEAASASIGDVFGQPHQAVDLLDKLAALFVDEGIDIGAEQLLGDEEDDILRQKRNMKVALRSVSQKETTSSSHDAASLSFDGNDQGLATHENLIPLNLESFLFDDTFVHSRIDYNINQMDITKMAINASKHLNLTSIHELPTRVYQSPCKHDISTFVGESWHIIPSKGSCDDVAATTECVICLEKFKCGDKLRVLPCGHQFHVGCIDHWLMGTYSDEECVTTGCPTCKKTVKHEGSNSEITEDEDIICVDENNSFPSWAFFKLGSILSKGSTSSSSSRSSNSDNDSR